ncbi:MAG: phospholipase [Bacteroidaceae bacterium]|nr:phospholipase [Bacteroidaceae bacterium]
MFPLILLLIILGVVAAIASIARQWWARKNGMPDPAETAEPVRDSRADGCCGQHETCEKDSLLAAVSKGIEYYEDEELDRFIGHPTSGYTEAEIEEFNEVLTTLRSEEVAGWIRSLQLRGVALPDELKDDVLLLVGERRIHP